MYRFSGAFTVFLASVAVVEASLGGINKANPNLREVAQMETLRNPKLKANDLELKRQLNQKLFTLNHHRLQEQDEAYQWDASYGSTQLGFDITKYSVKYTQCSTVQSYSDALAQDDSTSTVLEAKRFALFRLCPSDQCSDSSTAGCSSDYGDYIVSMDQFLMSMLEYQQKHVVGYCQYCQECATIESVKMFYKTVEQTRENALEQAQAAFETWEQNNQNNNNGQNGGDDAQKTYYYYLMNNANKNGNSNYANKYANNYYYKNNANANSNSNSGYMANQYSWDNQNMWDFQNGYQSAWQSMSSGTYGTYFGKKVLNGYLDANGDFVESWGYFDSSGNYVSIEREGGGGGENEEGFYWDEDLFGQYPSSWTNYTVDSESCNVEYAGSCYSQYGACMTILQDEDNKSKGYSQSGETLMDFLECTEVYPAEQQYSQQQLSYNDGNRDLSSERYFVGPHCGSNGKTITLAVYSDPYCALINEDASVKALLGYDPLSSTELIPSGCMGCATNEYDAWYEGDDVDGIQPMCSMLYQFSGKCNTNLQATAYSSYVYNNGQEEQHEEQDENAAQSYVNGWKQIYQSSQQEANEQAVCSFINSLASNTYDEHGQINVWSSPNWYANPAAWNKEFQAERKALGVGKKIGLILTAFAVLVMSVVVCVLQSQLAVRKTVQPWKPKRNKGEDPTDLARQNSGITMGRSRSGPGTAPLI